MSYILDHPQIIVGTYRAQEQNNLSVNKVSCARDYPQNDFLASPKKNKKQCATTNIIPLLYIKKHKISSRI